LIKPNWGPKDESKAVDKFSNQSKHERFTTDLSKDVIVKAPETSENLDLIHRSQAGDTEAFGELVTMYRAKIYTMLYGMVRMRKMLGISPRKAFCKLGAQSASWSVDLRFIRGYTGSR
jgi:hypothetical protein